ncbi:DNA methyltransferase, partial [Lactobacillus acetotolerans]|uniref:DNA methyltransferase n=1 Tax=Lactobacillus acetotolerans TaxID=1600 RepID=UPI002FDAE72E
IIWDKKNGQSDQADCELAWTNFRSVPRMISMASEKTGRVHPNQKPIKLFTEILERISNFNSSIVLDLFGRSGSTLMACEQTSRVALLMEYDPRYVDVIIKRWEEFTGKKAVKISE